VISTIARSGGRSIRSRAEFRGEVIDFIIEALPR